MSDSTPGERRKHKRLKVSHKTAAITIANHAYPILEMSSGGFSSHDIDKSLSFDEEHPTYILLHGLSLIHDVSVQPRWKGNVSASTEDSSTTSTVGFKFRGLKASQKLQLEAFLKWHTEPSEVQL